MFYEGEGGGPRMQDSVQHFIITRTNCIAAGFEKKGGGRRSINKGYVFFMILGLWHIREILDDFQDKSAKYT